VPTFREWLVWAEEVGVGDLGLMPDQFWSLTVREFRIKHRGFARQEDRLLGLVKSLGALTGHYSEKDRATLERQANALRRYPIKKWLLPKPQ
jgi:hypothetical protein